MLRREIRQEKGQGDEASAWGKEKKWKEVLSGTGRVGHEVEKFQEMQTCSATKKKSGKGRPGWEGVGNIFRTRELSIHKMIKKNELQGVGGRVVKKTSEPTGAETMTLCRMVVEGPYRKKKKEEILEGDAKNRPGTQGKIRRAGLRKKNCGKKH